MKAVKDVPLNAAERPFTIIAQDPAVHGADGNILTTQISVPAETLAPGPWGYRFQVVDYDASNQKFYSRWEYEKTDRYVDPYAGKKVSSRLLNDPRFHAQNVYAIAMRILARFEFAFGHRVGWAFDSHQLKIAPHAFEDANAYYDRNTESLQFGYFGTRDGAGKVFSCLSHDIVAHETTHAILDGLQSRYFYPSSPDQAAFHEAFSDIVALLSMFALPDVVEQLIEKHTAKPKRKKSKRTFTAKDVSIDAMRRSLLLGLAEQFGDEIKTVRGEPLRQSLLIKPAKHYRKSAEFEEPHRRGELLVAAVLNSFIRVFDNRVRSLDASGSGLYFRERVIEEAAKTADHLMTIVIRALDYCVPVHITFGDYLSGLLTSDAELVGDDTSYGYRRELIHSFAEFGIEPRVNQNKGEPGTWQTLIGSGRKLNYGRTHFGSFQSDFQEVYRFLWENRDELGIRDDVYTRVMDVRPCLRISPEGFPLRETVVQYVQIADIAARELGSRFKGVERPGGDLNPMSPSTRVTLHGGGTLVFNQYGRLKFDIATPVDGEEQSERLQYLWERGFFRDQRHAMARGFAEVHRLRSLRLNWADNTSNEAWI